MILLYLVLLVCNLFILKLRYIGGSFIDAFCDTNKMFLSILIVVTILGLLRGLA